MKIMEESAVMKLDSLVSRFRRPLLALGVMSVVVASASVWAQPPRPPTAVSVTSYYTDASHAYVAGVVFYGDCPAISSGNLIGASTPYSDTTTVMCDDVDSVPLPF